MQRILEHLPTVIWLFHIRRAPDIPRSSCFRVALFDLSRISCNRRSGRKQLTSLSLAALILLALVAVVPAAVLTRLAGLSGNNSSPPDTSFCCGLKPFASPAADLTFSRIFSISLATHLAQKRRACKAYGSLLSKAIMGETNPCSSFSSKEPYTHLFQSVNTQYLALSRLAAPHVLDQYQEALDLVLYR